MVPQTKPLEADTKQPPVILVVEDNPDTRRLLTIQLTRCNMQPVCVPDGKTALEWLADHNPDLVVLDLMLPDIAGLEICRRIRKHSSPTALPILMLSALGSQAGDRVRGLQAGANDFMAKPYEIEELVARIQGLLGVKGETDRIDRLLSRYMTRVVRQHSKINPETLKSRQQRHAVIMFADLRGFTRLSEVAQPDSMMTVIDGFFEAMLQIVDKNGGTVFDLLGDELLAAFNVPFDVPVPSYLAVQTALHMQRFFKDLQQQWARIGLEVGMGVGIHEGEVIVGNVGSDEQLMRYTIIGNAVNIAHRIVDLAADGEIVISSGVYDNMGRLPPTVEVQPIPQVSLKGVDKPPSLYRITAQSEKKATPAAAAAPDRA